MKQKIIYLLQQGAAWLNFLSPLSDLIARICVANIFWQSSLVKIDSMDSTLWLFANEYHVPFLPTKFAAYLATGIELGFPVLLVLGLFGRFAALVLFVFNIITVISYPTMPVESVSDHMIWGVLLLII